MRRLVVSVVVASGLALTGVGTAHAEPAPEAGAAKAAAGKKVCKVTDSRLDELSGMVATDDGFVVINDGSTRDSHRKIFFLDEDCEITEQVSYSGKGPRDTEDLILSADGKTLWIADIGDNDRDRETIVLWKMPADGSKKPKLYRLSYPEGDRHDAEALLLNGDGTPIIVTKEVGRPAALYTPTAELKAGDEGVPLRKVGEVTVPPSSTSGNTFARLGRGTISGGAVAPGGAKVVLRTYTDALEWSVTGGDVLAALKGEPRVTPLPDEPLGEAITYSPDGANFFTVSDMQGDNESADNYVLRYTPVTETATAAGAGAGDDDSGPSWFADLSINDITYMVGGVGVLGAILVGLGVFGIMRARKRPEPEPAAKAGAADLKLTDPETELLTVGGAATGPAAARGSGVYGGNRAGSPPGVYGGGRPPPAVPPPGGGVYGGGARPAPAQPARPGPAQPAGRPAPAQPAGRPGPGQPGVRPGPAQPPGRPGQGGQPGGRPGVAGRPVPGGAPPMGRPPGGGRPGPAGGRPPANGVHGEPQRPQERNNFADLNGYGRGRDLDNPGYGRTPQGR